MNLSGRSKYGSKKETVDGHTFDSKAEAEHYRKLKILQRIGEIAAIELQPKFELFPGYKHPVNGKKIQPIHYIADFRVTYPDGREEIIDVKGKKTDIYLLKKKIVEYKYQFEIVEVVA